MISIIVAVKDCRELAARCLDSLVHAVRVLGLQPVTEFIWIDDNSRADSAVPELFRAIRKTTSAPVRAIRFRTHQHYTYAVTLGMSLARGHCVLFFSHDMVVPPPCLAALLAHTERNPATAILRPASQHMDQAQSLQIVPPLPPRNFTDTLAWSRCVAQRFAGQLAPTPLFVGDAMLVTRRCIDALGVFDTRFIGFLGDFDYGLRAQIAGMMPVVALDAWLHHFGGAAGAEAEQRKAQGLTDEHNPELGLPMIHRAYEVFRQKWDTTLPDGFFQLVTDDLERLARRPRESLEFPLHQPPIAFDPAICEEI